VLQPGSAAARMPVVSAKAGTAAALLDQRAAAGLPVAALLSQPIAATDAGVACDCGLGGHQELPAAAAALPALQQSLQAYVKGTVSIRHLTDFHECGPYHGDAMPAASTAVLLCLDHHMLAALFACTVVCLQRGMLSAPQYCMLAASQLTCQVRRPICRCLSGGSHGGCCAPAR
jgi:hypothetical protein